MIIVAARNLFPSSPSQPASETDQAATENVITTEHTPSDLPVMMGTDRSKRDGLSYPYAWGNDLIKREAVRNITFLDSMDNVPSDAWDISSAGDGSVKAWVIENGDLYDMFIAGNGRIQAPADCSDLFADYINLSELNFNDCFYANNSVTDISGMFDDCNSLTQLDLSGFDTSSVTTMGFMFCGCRSLTQLDVSHFDTSSVEDMHSMFSGCKSLTQNPGTQNFNFQKVEDMADFASGTPWEDSVN